MTPSEVAIARFISCVPDADEGKAWVFLEVNDQNSRSVIVAANSVARGQ